MGNCLCRCCLGNRNAGRIRVTRRVIEFMNPFVLSDEDYVKISMLLKKEMEEGLKKGTTTKASLPMLATYVTSLPDGNEYGHYLALDLEGASYRILLVSLKGTRVEMKSRIFVTPKEVTTGVELFDLIAESIADFLKVLGLDRYVMYLGFSISFACKNQKLNSATLTQWAKGFEVFGVIGKDMVELLHDAIKRRKDIDVRCVALINDTVSCLMSCAFHDNNCSIGVVLGSGTNACYVEDTEEIGHLDEAQAAKTPIMIVNTEWGCLGDKRELNFARTKQDAQIDSSSRKPGFHTFEKMISSLYLGELVRLCVVELAQLGIMFNGAISDALTTPYNFRTRYLSEVERDTPEDDYERIREIMTEMGYKSIRRIDCSNLKYISSIIIKRAAYLAGSGIATLINRSKEPLITVAVDGNLYRNIPTFPELVDQKVAELAYIDKRFRLMLTDDGRGKGSALVVAAAQRKQ